MRSVIVLALALCSCASPMAMARTGLQVASGAAHVAGSALEELKACGDPCADEAAALEQAIAEHDQAQAQAASALSALEHAWGVIAPYAKPHVK